MKHGGGLEMRDGDNVMTASDAVEKVKQGKIQTAKELKLNVAAKETKKPFEPPYVPKNIANIAGSLNGGGAGAFLLISAFFPGKRVGLASLAAALFILVGNQLPIPLVNGSTWIAAG